MSEYCTSVLRAPTETGGAAALPADGETSQAAGIITLRVAAEEIRDLTLGALMSVGGGHAGGCMSVIETLAVLYSHYLRVDPQNPCWNGRDRMIMSKGHAAAALYAALAHRGFFPADRLLLLNKTGQSMPAHCDRLKVPGVDATTGSLGQGLSLASGMALGLRMDGCDAHVYAILGDGECDEGQVWEAFLFAAHHKLDNLTVFIDHNGLQLDGYTRDILDLGDLTAKLAAFNWHTQAVDGQDLAAVDAAVQTALTVKGQPTCIVLSTIKTTGLPGVPEDNSHYVAFTPALSEAVRDGMAGRLRAARAGVPL